MLRSRNLAAFTNPLLFTGVGLDSPAPGLIRLVRKIGDYMYLHCDSKRFSFNSVVVDDEGNLFHYQTLLFHIVPDEDFIFCPNYLIDYYESYLKSLDKIYEIIPFDLVIDV